jgi:hypothetical protein
MDTVIPTILAVLALFGLISLIAGYESRDGFDAHSTEGYLA